MSQPGGSENGTDQGEDKSLLPKRLIACGVFEPALKHLQIGRRYPHLRVTYLPSNLHVNPRALKDYLGREFHTARQRDEQVLCLYGQCFPDIEEFCKRHGAIKVPGHHCYEMLLGAEQFQKAVDEAAGTYFLERDLITNFEKYCLEPLELYDEAMRKYCFAHYQRLLYVRQPSDPDLVPRAKELAKFLELSLDIRDANYAYLRRSLIELI